VAACASIEVPDQATYCHTVGTQGTTRPESTPLDSLNYFSQARSLTAVQVITELVRRWLASWSGSAIGTGQASVSVCPHFYELPMTQIEKHTVNLGGDYQISTPGRLALTLLRLSFRPRFLKLRSDLGRSLRPSNHDYMFR
jgi:hypothetical protein